MEREKRKEYFIFTNIFWWIGFIIYGVLAIAGKDLLEIPLNMIELVLISGIAGGLLLGGLVSGIILFSRFFKNRTLFVKIILCIFFPLTIMCIFYVGIFSFFPYGIYNFIVWKRGKGLIKEINYRKNGAVYRIEIEGLDDEEEAQIIKNLIKDLSVNRRVFLSGDTSAIDKKAVIRMETDPKYRFAAKMEISPEKIEGINILELLENMWTNIYFFRSSVDWKDFVEMKKVNLYFKRGDLEAAIYLYNLDGISIEIGENYSHHMDELFRQLQKENFVIKKRL